MGATDSLMEVQGTLNLPKHGMGAFIRRFEDCFLVLHKEKLYLLRT